MTVSDTTVKVSGGLLRGTVADGCLVFRGIPYARPPIGPLRFRPPVTCEPWTDVLDAAAVGPISYQFPNSLEMLQGRPDLPQSEDCLSLNVWTRNTDGDDRPVMVWIHGGGYLNGTGAADWFDGTSFALTHNVVLVTINYRLNVFGYLHLANLAPNEEGSGNCGLLDQIAALKWVRDNIASFGGDPNNVTLFGESAGAMSVGVILGTPSAAGLVHRAILQSGAAVNVTTAEDATAVTTSILAHLGLSPNQQGVAELRRLPAGRIMEAYGAVMVSQPPDMAAKRVIPTFAPVVDHFVLPVPPMEAISAGASASVPVMIGTNVDEMEIMRLIEASIYDFDDDELWRRAGNVFGDLASDALALYRVLGHGTTQHSWIAVDTDRMFLLPAIELAETRTGAKGITWMYLFRWATSSFGGDLGAVHTLEIPFVFNTLDRSGSLELTGGPTEAARPLAEEMHRTWAAFARNGDPTNKSIPEWTPYESGRRATMIFGLPCVVEDDPLRNRRVFWQERLGRAKVANA
jgi:para-nitrobenzyl esterase